MLTWIQFGLSVTLIIVMLVSARVSKKRKELFADRQQTVGCITEYLRSQLAENKLCYRTIIEDTLLSSYSFRVYEYGSKNSPQYDLVSIKIEFIHQSSEKYVATFKYFDNEFVTEAKRWLRNTSGSLNKDEVKDIIEMCLKIRQAKTIRNVKGVWVRV